METYPFPSLPILLSSCARGYSFIEYFTVSQMRCVLLLPGLERSSSWTDWSLGIL